MNEQANPAKTYGSFEEFWPDYVRAHTNKTNRQLHFIGLTLGAACAGSAVLFRKPLLLLAAPVFGYGLSWVGHFVFEKNTPASFTNPIYSFRGDLRMWSKMATGTMDAEVERFTREAADATETNAADGAKGTSGPNGTSEPTPAPNGANGPGVAQTVN
jgi:hypothetical protein